MQISTYNMTSQVRISCWDGMHEAQHAELAFNLPHSKHFHLQNFEFLTRAFVSWCTSSSIVHPFAWGSDIMAML